MAGGNMSLSEGISAMAQAIADHITGAKGSATKAASIADIILALTSGPKTQDVILQLINEVAEEYTKP